MALKLIRQYLLVTRTEWRAFMIYGLAFALLNLLVPFIVQLLVGNLLLAGLGLSLFTLSLLLLTGLIALQACRYGQIMLLEFLERQFVYRHTHKFQGIDSKDQTMFFELPSVTKSLAKWALDGFETFLALIVGSVVLMIYHPYFVVLSLFIWGGLYFVNVLGHRGQETSIEESKSKYEVWFKLLRNEPADGSVWLKARHFHFQIIRRQILLLMLIQIIGPLALLVGGALLFQANELSLGQFVAAELIGTGVFVALGKLAKFIEVHYSLITSLYKIDHAIGVGHD